MQCRSAPVSMTVMAAKAFIYNKLDHNHPFLDLIYTLLWTCVTKEPISNWARISQEPSVATSSVIGLQAANPPTALKMLSCSRGLRARLLETLM